MLSVVIITKNEEENIGRCIESVKEISDDIVVVDSGSTDRTVEIAKSLGARTFYKEWQGYSVQKNYAVGLAKNEWVLSLDADEELSTELAQEILKRIGSGNYDCYLLNRQTYYLGAFLKHGWFPEWRLRLFKKGIGKFEEEAHDVCRCKGRVGRIEKGVIYHYSFKSLESHVSKSVSYAKLVAETLHAEGKRVYLSQLILRPLWHFLKVYILKKGFLEGRRGLLISVIGAFYTFLKYAFLLELQLKERYGERLWRKS